MDLQKKNNIIKHIHFIITNQQQQLQIEQQKKLKF